MSKPYPCVRCGKFNTVLGEARCVGCQHEVDRLAEMDEYGHTAALCPYRIDVSTHAKQAWIHGPCKPPKEEQVAGPEIDFTFVAGNKEYHITGDMQSIEKQSLAGYSPSGTMKITVTLWGEVETRQVHSDPHFKVDGRHKFCTCTCSDCEVIVGSKRRCGCEECSCGG